MKIAAIKAEDWLTENVPYWDVKQHKSLMKLLKEQERDTRHACAKLRPMSEAPRDEEILAYHKNGKNFHQVKWKDYKKRWRMRWHEEYSQSDFDYTGWLPMPDYTACMNVKAV